MRSSTRRPAPPSRTTRTERCGRASTSRTTTGTARGDGNETDDADAPDAGANGTAAAAGHADARTRAHAHGAGKEPGQDVTLGAQSSGSQRGQGILNALQHVPARVAAHLQSILDAFAEGVQGVGSLLAQPLHGR